MQSSSKLCFVLCYQFCQDETRNTSGRIFQGGSGNSRSGHCQPDADSYTQRRTLRVYRREEVQREELLDNIMVDGSWGFRSKMEPLPPTISKVNAITIGLNDRWKLGIRRVNVNSDCGVATNMIHEVLPTESPLLGYHPGSLTDLR